MNRPISPALLPPGSPPPRVHPARRLSAERADLRRRILASLAGDHRERPSAFYADRRSGETLS